MYKQFKKIVTLFFILIMSIDSKGQISFTVHTNTIIANNISEKWGMNLNAGIDADANRATGSRPLYEALIEMGVKHLRFPGGEKSDYYKWAAAPYTSASTVSWVAGYYANVAKNTINFDQFMTICAKTGAQAHINVAYNPTAGLDEKLAAEWVRYANIVKKYGVKNWEIGNEMWAKDKGLTATQCASIALRYAIAMKAVDPTIKVGISWEGQSGYQTILQAVGDKLDFVTCSNYMISADWSNYNTYASMPNTDLFANGARGALNATSSDRNKKKVVISEFNAISWYKTNWSNANDLGHALVNFETIGQMMTEPNLDYGCFWNTRWYGEEGNSYTIYTGLDSNNNLHAAALPLAVWGKFIEDRLVDINSSESIKNYAAYNANTGALNIFLENKSVFAQTINVPIMSLNNYSSSSDVWQLKGTGDKDRFPTWSKIGSVNVSNNKIATINLPPISVTVVALKATNCKQLECIVSGIDYSSSSGKNEIFVYPNPSKDGIFHLSQTADWKVYLLLGKELKSGNGNQINLSDYPKGVYLIKLNDKIQRVIVE